MCGIISAKLCGMKNEEIKEQICTFKAPEHRLEKVRELNGMTFYNDSKATNPEASIVITTHLITDVEQVLDDFIFMGYGGQIMMSGNAEEARNQTGKSLDELFKEVFRC